MDQSNRYADLSLKEEDLIAAIEDGHTAIKAQVKAQEELRALVGVTTKRDYTKPYRNEELNAKIVAFAQDKVLAISASASAKHDRSDAYKALKEELVSIASIVLCRCRS